MRGEDVSATVNGESWVGSPPHARGRRCSAITISIAVRITPACAGKTPKGHAAFVLIADHPRMRGEDEALPRSGGIRMGSPPHARGRLAMLSDVSSITRITPACAGKTCVFSLPLHRGTDHPRMRGEDAPNRRAQRHEAGSPPHARGRLVGGHVGKQARADHPRMRGEDPKKSLIAPQMVGSPPHARGRRQDRVVQCVL